MAATPSNVYVQQGNGDVLVSWDLTAGAVSYNVRRSTDGITYNIIANPTSTEWLDSTVTVGTKYYYQVASYDGIIISAYSVAQSIVPTLTGDMTLGQIRLLAQQKADMQNSNFVTVPEWNTYINNSYFELYDLLVTLYEDYYATSYTFQTNGTDNRYTLQNDFYKLLGVDIGLDTNTNAWVTLKKFDFIGRNRYVFPQLTATYLGVFNLRYRLLGNTLMFIPTPSANQYLRYWYIPKLTQLLQDTDILVGISGWGEYVAVDAAIKALEKEESDPTALLLQKQSLIKRIEESAMNRDAGQPDTISDVRNRAESWGGSGPNGDGGYAGY